MANTNVPISESLPSAQDTPIHQDGETKVVGGTKFTWDSNLGPSGGGWTADAKATAESKAGKRAQATNDNYGIANSNSKSGTKKGPEGQIVSGHNAFSDSGISSPEEKLEEWASTPQTV